MVCFWLSAPRASPSPFTSSVARCSNHYVLHRYHRYISRLIPVHSNMCIVHPLAMIVWHRGHARVVYIQKVASIYLFGWWSLVGSDFHNARCSFQYALRFRRDYLEGLGQLKKKKVPFSFVTRFLLNSTSTCQSRRSAVKVNANNNRRETAAVVVIVCIKCWRVDFLVDFPICTAGRDGLNRDRCELGVYRISVITPFECIVSQKSIWMKVKNQWMSPTWAVLYWITNFMWKLVYK